MADSTTNIDTISNSQSQKEVTANQYFDAASISTAFGRRGSTSSGLTWGYYGIGRWYINETATAKANATIALTGSTPAGRFVSVNRSLTVSEPATAFDADKLALYKVATGASSVSSYEDHRDPHHVNRFLYGRFTLAMADANKTLTYEQAMCESMELTGALSALRDVIVPTVPRSYIVFANTTGFGVQVKTAAGSGITIAVGKRAIVECDGTNVVRITADNP
jgi:hypothetical protein